jgi:hypothetical protein
MLNVISAAEQIIEKYQTHQYVILVAQPQSGKTSVCKEVIQLLNDKIVYLICGMNYNNLKEQHIKEFDGLIEKENILFSKDLEKLINLDIKFVQNNLLFIIDESHYSQNAKKDKDNNSNLIYKFFKNCVGLTLDAHIEKWIPDTHESLILSVSATPMSEIANIDDNKCQVILKPNNNYMGVEEMYNRGQIYEAFDLNKYMDKFIEEIKQIKENKYVIVRTTNKNYDELENKLTDCDVIKFHSLEMTIKNINTIVSVRPKILTVICIFHSLRAGIQLDTTHIALVYEHYNAKTDTTIQGLVGRCCGYYKRDNKVRIFCNIGAVKKYIKWINNDYQIKLIPSGSRNIKKTTDGKDMFETNKILGVKLTNQLLLDLETYLDNNTRRYDTIWDIFGLKILTELYQKYDIKILQDAVFWGMMIFDTKNKASSRKQWIERVIKGYLNGKESAPFYNFNPDKMKDDKLELYKKNDNFYFVYIELDKTREYYGHVFIPSKKKTEHVFVLTTKKEQFYAGNNLNLNRKVISIKFTKEQQEKIDTYRLLNAIKKPKISIHTILNKFLRESNLKRLNY